MKTVFMVTRTVVTAMKTVVMPTKGIYSGLRKYLFAAGDSSGVQFFYNVRIFSFLITKEFCFICFAT
jgi:hypothetical protein